MRRPFNAIGDSNAALAALVMAAATIAVAGTAAAQTRPSRDTIGEAVGAGRLAGVVVDDTDSGQAVRRATVELRGGSLRSARQTITGDDGRYAFDDLAPGRYSIQVARPGFVQSYHGSRRPWQGPGAPIDLAAGEARLDLRTVIARGGVITGRVFDEHGQAMPNVAVHVMERRVVGGTAQLARVGAQGRGTDDRGVYRVYGLPPGRYLVAASAQQQMAGARLVSEREFQWAAAVSRSGASAPPPPDARSAADLGAPPAGGAVTYAVLYFPGTPDVAAASTVTIEPGVERAGLDIALRFVPTALLSGTLRMPDGSPATGASLTLRRRAALMGEPTTASTTRVTAQGTFVFPAIEPGAYLITASGSSAQAPPPAPPTGAPVVSVPRTSDLWAELEVFVDGRDQDDLTVRYQPGMTVSGRVVFAGDALSVDALPGVTVRLISGPGQPFPTPPQSPPTSGTFTISNVAPGSYRLQAAMVTAGPRPPGSPRWVPASALWNGRDLLDEPAVVTPGQSLSDVVVTFTTEVAELSGRLVDGSDRPVTAFYVMAFSADPSHWRAGSRRVRSPVRPQPDGGFRFDDLPPGDYFLAALADFDIQDVTEPGFLEQVAEASVRLTIGPGQKAVQDIRVR